MQTIKSKYFGQWELRANGVTQGGRTFKSTVELLMQHGDTKQQRDAMEFYPKESRLHDTDNCYHLFVLPEHLTFPLGYGLRDVSDKSSPTQRLLVPHGT